MKEYEIKITPYAYNQMAEIRDYIALELMNPNAALNFIEDIRSATMGLKQMPLRIKTIDEEPWKTRGIRKISVKNFFVYFWVDEVKCIVHIIAVAYAKREQTNVLDNIEE